MPPSLLTEQQDDPTAVDPVEGERSRLTGVREISPPSNAFRMELSTGPIASLP
jgi:hypothetical protein